MIDHGAVLLAARSHLLDLEVTSTDDNQIVRASTATYTDNAGLVQTAAVNTYRNAHYVNGVLTPLFEASATNLLRQSEDFTTSWAEETVLGNAQGAAANTHTSPTGAMTADRFDYVTQTLAIADAGSYTFSCYVKQNQSTTFDVEIYTKTSASAGSKTRQLMVRYTFTAGVPDAGSFIGGTSGTLHTKHALADGWYRIGFSGTLPVSAFTYVQIIGNSGLNGRLTAWGAQLETGSTMTSYIPTTTAAATRAADTYNLAATTSGFTRTVGSFLTDGFAVGMEVTPTGFTTTTPGTITALTATTMTVTGTRTADSAAGGRTLAVDLPTVRAWENVDATPVVGAPWIEEAYLPGAADKPSVTSEGYVEVLPIYSITVRTPLGIGTAGILGYVDALLAHFAPSTPLTLTSGDGLTVRGRPAPTASPIVRGEGWAACQVSIPLRLITANSR